VYVVPVQVVTFKHAVDEGLAPRLQRRDADPGDSAKKSRVQGQPLNVLEFSGENSARICLGAMLVGGTPCSGGADAKEAPPSVP